MIISEEKKREYAWRLLLSRMRLLADNGFYGLLLMHMGYGIDENCSTAATDGKKIIFGPAFLEEISDRELDFVMWFFSTVCARESGTARDLTSPAT